MHRDVGRCFDQAFVDGADAVPDFQAEIPEQLHDFFQLGAQGRIGNTVQQDQDIDVGMRKQFAAAVAADCHQRRVLRHAVVVPGAGQYAVDAFAQARQQQLRLAVRLEGVDHRLSFRFELFFES